MSRVLRIVCTILLLWVVPVRADDAWLASQKKFHEIASDHGAVDRLLAALQKRCPDFQQRLRAIVLLRVGTPYVLGCLGEEAGRDRDPVFRLDRSDCTVHVLTSSALAHSRSWAEARDKMTFLGYYPDGAASDRSAIKRGPVTYENRIHFTEDRLVSSPWFAVVPTSARAATTTLTLNRKADGSPLLDIPWKRRATVRYVPVDLVTRALLSELPPHVAGVAFVRKKLFAMGLAVAHEGTILDRRWLVHADSIGKRTSKVDFLEYLQRNSDWFDGVIFFAFR